MYNKDYQFYNAVATPTNAAAVRTTTSAAI